MQTRNPDLENKKSSRFNDYPFLSPRCWHGMTVRSWLQFLHENEYRVDRLPLVIGVSMLAPLNSVFARMQKLLHWKRAVATQRDSDPLFVIGHWRTGTTFLEYVLGLDDRRRAPDTYECMTPDHFLFSRLFGQRLMSCPNRRPMDNIAMGWKKPQEDEFIFAVSGATSVYRHFGFPKEPYRHIDSLTMDNVSLKELVEWKETMSRFVTYLNYTHKKPLVFKSPTHTGRIQVLLEMFPNAKFIHITRDPVDFIPSTMYLWQSLDATSGLQRKVDHIDHEDYVFDCFHRMYDSFESRKHLIPNGNLCEVTYDEITGNTTQTMQRVYESLDLGDFSYVEPKIADYAESKRDYQRNKHEITDRLKSRIREECSDYIAQYCRPADVVPMRRAA